MTRAEAIEYLEIERIDYDLPVYKDSPIREALNMAIEALKQPEQKKGKWIKAYPTNPEVWMCSECHYIDEPKWSYCRNCGAEMENRNDKRRSN